MSIKKLIWDNKYSVQVREIDEQHQQMFATINKLIDVLAATPTKDSVAEIISELIDYKQYHFATEEKYFEKFNYRGKNEHIKIHQQFGQKIDQLTKDAGGDPIRLAFSLVDFLEDWLIDHLMVEDQKYVACFKENGLK